MLSISPTGTDSFDCGAQSNKCQTISYAFHKTTSNNITFMLQTSANISINYTIFSSIVIKRKIRLEFRKENENHVNPAVLSNVTSLFQLDSSLDLHISSIDLYNVNLLRQENSSHEISVLIRNSSIYHDEQFFIEMRESFNFSNINILHCSLKSSIGTNWMNMTNENTSFNATVNVKNSIIEGGVFYFKNVEKFVMSSSLVQNGSAKFKKRPFLFANSCSIVIIQNITARNIIFGAFFTGIAPEEGINTNKYLTNTYIIKDVQLEENTLYSFIGVQNVKNFAIENVSIKNIRFKRAMFIVRESNGAILNINVQNLELGSAFFAYRAHVSITNVELKDSLIERRGIIAYPAEMVIKNLTVIRTNFINKYSIIFVWDKSNLTIHNFRLKDVKATTAINLVQNDGSEVTEGSTATISNVSVENLKLTGTFLFAYKSDVSITEIYISHVPITDNEAAFFRIESSSSFILSLLEMRNLTVHDDIIEVSGQSSATLTNVKMSGISTKEAVVFVARKSKSDLTEVYMSNVVITDDKADIFRVKSSSRFNLSGLEMRNVTMHNDIIEVSGKLCNSYQCENVRHFYKRKCSFFITAI